MSALDEYGSHDALALAHLVRSREVSPRELVDEAIRRIEIINPRLNAVVYKLYDKARHAADSTSADHPFAGVPFLLKDLLSALAGEPLSSGMRFYEDWRPDTNAEIVNRYLGSGVIVVGKTNTPELGLLPSTEPTRFGACRNPWDPHRTAGGSSGGAAAAVSARIVPMAGGGDGGGSIRIPASCCGLFGLKPSRGRTPTGPLQAENWNGFAQEHVLTRSVRDSAAMLDAICGPFAGDVHYLPKPEVSFARELERPPGKLRIAFSATPYLPAKVHQDCTRALDDAVSLLTDLGHELVEAHPAIDGEAFARAFLVMMGGNTWADIRTAEERMGKRGTRLDFEDKTWLAQAAGEAFCAGEYVKAIAQLHHEARKVHVFMKDYDLLLSPTLALPPEKLGFLNPHGLEAVMQAFALRLPVHAMLKSKAVLDQAAADAFAFIPYTPVFNVTGQPSMSVPLHWNAVELPIGVMFTGRFGDEATLFRLAAQLEQARPWGHRKPPISAS